MEDNSIVNSTTNLQIRICKGISPKCMNTPHYMQKWPRQQQMLGMLTNKIAPCHTASHLITPFFNFFNPLKCSIHSIQALHL